MNRWQAAWRVLRGHESVVAEPESVEKLNRERMWADFMRSLYMAQQAEMQELRTRLLAPVPPLIWSARTADPEVSPRQQGEKPHASPAVTWEDHLQQLHDQQVQDDKQEEEVL